MTRKTYMKSKLVAVLLVVSVFVNIAVLMFVMFNGFSRTQGMKMIKTREPMLIGGQNGDENYYVLPMGATVYYDKSFSEGFSRYMVYFNHHGPIVGDEVPMEPKYQGSLVDPLWLSDVDADTLKEIFKRFPLSKKDIAAAIKSNEITKDDLADIIRSMPD